MTASFSFMSFCHFPDTPTSEVHPSYFSNPSYHTLTQCMGPPYVTGASYGKVWKCFRKNTDGSVAELLRKSQFYFQTKFGQPSAGTKSLDQRKPVQFVAPTGPLSAEWNQGDYMDDLGQWWNTAKTHFTLVSSRWHTGETKVKLKSHSSRTHVIHRCHKDKTPH